jgi:hypothetical protein
VPVDWKRILGLNAQLAGFQFGFTGRARASSLTAVQVVGAQVLRFQGDVTDFNPWRLYLGPWLPQSTLAVPDVVTDNILPGLFPPALPTYNEAALLSGYSDLLIYASVRWGTAVPNQRAIVDWPLRGQLLNVSGNFASVDAFAIGADLFSDGDASSRLPDLPATMSDDAGGTINATACATLTYPFQLVDLGTAFVDPTTDLPGINCTVPPFAKAVRFMWDNTKTAPTGKTYATGANIRLRRSASTTEEDGVYVYDWDAGDIGDPRQGIPLPASTAYVRVEFTGGTTNFVGGVGIQYELAL